MKKKYMIIGGAILVIAAVILLLFVFGGSDEIESDDPDSLYKYYYEKDGKSMIVTVKGSFPDGYTWKADKQSDEVAIVSCLSSDKKEASFRVTPVGEGRFPLVMALQNDGIMPDRVYEISVNFEVDPETVTVLASSHKELEGLVTNEKGGYKYSYAEGPDNCLYISVENGQYEFAEMIIGNSVYMSQTETKHTDESTIYILNPVKTGNTIFRVCDVNGKKAIRFDLEVFENGKVTVNTHDVSEYDISTDPAKERKSEAEKKIGTIKLPDDCVLVDVNNIGVTVSYSEYFDGIDLTIEREGRQIGCLVVPDADPSAVSTRYMTEDAELTDTKIGESDALRVESAYYVTVIWSENGKTIAVTEAKASADHVVGDAEAISGSFGSIE